jgi:hypothetical protein
VVSRHGERFIVSWTFAAMHDEKGNIEYVIATGIDITKRKMAEGKLQKANNELAPGSRSWRRERKK